MLCTIQNNQFLKSAMKQYIKKYCVYNVNVFWVSSLQIRLVSCVTAEKI